MTDSPILISESNLSYAWGKAFLRVMAPPGANRLGPLLITVDGFIKGQPQEDPGITTALDEALARQDAFHRQSRALAGKPVRTHKFLSIKECAFTIFPYRRWVSKSKISASEVFRRFEKSVLPRIKARDPRNSYGTYFERMIAYTGSAGDGSLKKVNQLDQIIKIWRRDRMKGRSPRHTALQVSCFDPAKDHTGQVMRGFPCLQQISFAYDHNNGLAISGYYPTQYIFDRGYGNYLGLCQLGHFMASEMGLTLVRMNCFIGYPQIGTPGKQQLRHLEDVVKKTLLTTKSENS